MAVVSTLEITDGTTTLDLIKGGAQVGIHLFDWTPAIALPKRGGVFQTSSLSEGRRLVDRKFDNVVETFDIKINNISQNRLIEETQELFRLLEKATQYWTTDWQDEPVWIKAKAGCEDNDRYAVVVNYEIPELDNPYAQPFASSVGNFVGMDRISLVLERLHWQADEPGSSTCVEASSVQSWQYAPFWAINAALTPGGAVPAIYSLLQTADGNIYAGDYGNIQVSTDNGDTWGVNTALPTDEVYSLLQTVNGYIYAGDLDQIWRSVDNGASWQVNFAPASSNIFALIQTTNGDIYASDQTHIYRSTNNGASWSTVATIAAAGTIFSLLQTANGYIYAGGQNGVWRSIDSGTTWQLNLFVPINPPSTFTSLLQTTNGFIYAGRANDIWVSADNGENWDTSTTLPTGFVYSLLQAENGYIYAGDQGNVLRSVDDGENWAVDTTLPTDFVRAMIQTTNDYIYAGGDELVWGRPILVDMGRGDTCNNEVYFVNKQNIANVTHVKVDNGGVFTDIFPIASFPQDLLPAVPAANDALYIGIDTGTSGLLDTGPFCGVVFDIGTVIISSVPGVTYTIDTEYWNGAAWVALTTTDNTSEGNPFQKTGVNSIHFEHPNNWNTTAIDGVTAYWIRFNLSALAGGTISPPTQQNRDIYALTRPYVKIDDADILGDIPALLRQKIQNRSDQDGRGGSGPDLWTNRLICGLRSLDRGDKFQAYINLSDEQNPPEITITATGANTTFVANIETPTGRVARYNPAGVEAMATQVTVAFAPTIASDFYGTFHAFLRVDRDAGVSTDFDVQLELLFGSGGVSFTTESKQIQTTTAYEVLDFGQINLPPTSLMGTSDLGDTAEIRIQASAASGTPLLTFIDLILIPVDEWVIDSIDFANTTDSIIGSDDTPQKLLDINSVTNPKAPVQSLVRLQGSERITSIYNTVTNGKAILQANTEQCLWFFAAQTSATGSSYDWIAPFEISHSIQLSGTQRYLGLRGDR